ncbi:sensor histidine kinase [Bacillus sp. KH172YL63]|uniref:sensor histidine kinase n=1 Tax=Bacillus sp. KH172YL63 TaxID=2709784 RepID=UPI0013E47171|nr:sensor histidine kinase [Bacillus sp. KH172YL63]BCB05216.1 sensor histidine kinase YfiJ [Bacillus sp. KH172YL63]
MKLTFLTGLRLVMLLMISYIYYGSVGTPTALQLIFVISAGIGFTLNHLLFVSERGDRYYPLPLVLDFILITGFVLFQPNSSLYLILFGVNAVSLFLTAENRRVLYMFSIAFFITWFGAMYYIYEVTGVFSPLENVINFSFILFQAVVGRLIHKLLRARTKIETQYGELQSAHDELASAHEQLHQYAKQVEELTLVRERNRISGEIHDTVGHKMTALLVQLQVAKELMETRPDVSRQKIGLCEGLARETLQEIRLSVRTLKDDNQPQSFITTIRKLLEDYQEMTGLVSTFTVKGDAMTIPVSLQMDLTRVIQESITNAVRHGRAKTCSVTLEVSVSDVTVGIHDDGVGAGDIHPGFGLKHMRDRIHEHGGTTVFQSTEEGFLVKAAVPLKEMKWQMGGA